MKQDSTIYITAPQVVADTVTHTAPVAAAPIDHLSADRATVEDTTIVVSPPSPTWSQRTDWTVRPIHAVEESEALIIPPYDAADTLIDTDLSAALAARYSTDSATIEALRVAVPEVQAPPKWDQGLQGTPRTINAGDDSGVLAIVTGMFLLLMLSYRHCRRLFTVLFKGLWSMRRRENVFDEHTSNETQVLALMAVQWSVYTGLLLYSFISSRYHLEVRHTFHDTILLIALTGGYYILQLFAYNIVGYTFSTRQGQRYFVQGFTSSQSLLGFLLVIPALVALFYPTAAESMIILSAGFYLLARITFIIKGFRIFYDKISSLLYFILYLCTLEIIPLIGLYNLALFLVNSD